MKLQLNGALTIGTLDGANVEILEEVGPENIFIFGMTAQEIEQRRPTYNPWTVFHEDEEIRRVLELIEQDFFSLLEPGIFKPIFHSLLDGGDRYMVLAELKAYIDTQRKVDTAFKDPEAWDRKAIINVARAGKFSSDRTIQDYASEVWHIQACHVEPPVEADL